MLGEDGVQAIHFNLQFRLGGIRQRLMRRVVVLMRAGGDRGVAVAVLGVLDRLVDMQGNHTDGADAAGLGHEHTLGTGGNRVSS